MSAVPSLTQSAVVPLEDLRHFPPCTSASHPWDSQILWSLPACSGLIAAKLSQAGNCFGSVQEQQRSKCRLSCSAMTQTEISSHHCPSLTPHNFLPVLRDGRSSQPLGSCTYLLPTFGVLHIFVPNLWGPAHICSVALENGRNVFPQTKGHSRGGGRV